MQQGHETKRRREVVYCTVSFQPHADAGTGTSGTGTGTGINSQALPYGILPIAVPVRLQNQFIIRVTKRHLWTIFPQHSRPACEDGCVTGTVPVCTRYDTVPLDIVYMLECF